MPVALGPSIAGNECVDAGNALASTLVVILARLSRGRGELRVPSRRWTKVGAAFRRLTEVRAKQNIAEMSAHER